MTAVSRLGDMSTGHGCFPPTNMVQTPTSKTYFNGILAGVVSGDCRFASHTCGTVTHSTNERPVISGASKTYIEGKLTGRIGDSIGCGDVVAEGSPNSFVE